MRDYWLTQEALRATGFGFLVLALLGLGLALWLPKTRGGKARALAAVAILIAIPMSQVVRGVMEAREIEARRDKANALFAERCKMAGEKIYKTVDNVDGVLLTNVRPAKISDSSQYDSDDQYGYNVGGDEYIRYYLIGGKDLTSRYKFVEATQDSRKIRFSTPLSAAKSYEYWTRGGGKVAVDSKPIDDYSARYAIEWRDVSTQEDRDSWIAGGALQISDRKTGEVLGERVGYLFETGFGGTAGQRSPWSWARYYAKSCPSLNEHNREFVEKVLKPTKGE